MRTQITATNFEERRTQETGLVLGVPVFNIKFCWPWDDSISHIFTRFPDLFSILVMVFVDGGFTAFQILTICSTCFLTYCPIVSTVHLNKTVGGTVEDTQFCINEFPSLTC